MSNMNLGVGGLDAPEFVPPNQNFVAKPLQFVAYYLLLTTLIKIDTSHVFKSLVVISAITHYQTE